MTKKGNNNTTQTKQEEKNLENSFRPNGSYPGKTGFKYSPDAGHDSGSQKEAG